MTPKKIVLAYSGGLDTSVCVRYLKDRYGAEVIGYTCDLGQGVDRSMLEKRCRAAGGSGLIVEDARREFVEGYIFRALRAEAVYESKYYLGTALSRPLIAKNLVACARRLKADTLAHGCTGKGNDQVRLEVSFQALAPDLAVLAPLREWDLSSRAEEIDYAKRHRIPIDVTKRSPYSIDANLWGVSIECGVLEDPGQEPPRDVWQVTSDPEDAPQRAEVVRIGFEKGIPKTLNGKALNSVDLIRKVHAIGARHGIGRSDLIENRLVGIKSREVYEAPAAAVLFAAHRALEELVLDRELFHFKQGVSLKYAELVYYGLWFTPLRQALDRFVDETQARVTGTVAVKLHRGSVSIVSRASKFSRYRKELATYEPGAKFDEKLAGGFIQIWGMPYRGEK